MFPRIETDRIAEDGGAGLRLYRAGVCQLLYEHQASDGQAQDQIHMTLMTGLGLIERKGSGPGAYYELSGHS
jgi:hypothetical protein